MTKKEVATIKSADKITALLAEVGLDMSDELAEFANESVVTVPQVKIDHSRTGNHKLFWEFGKSYLEEESQKKDVEGNSFDGVVFAYQNIRALFNEGETMPVCAAIEGKISSNIKKPLSSNCLDCEHNVIGGECKPKVRLWIITELDGAFVPVVFNIPTTSIKKWSGKNGHVRKLLRSKVPPIAALTQFGLEAISDGAFMYAEVTFDTDLRVLPPKEMLMAAKIARDEFEKFMSELSNRDFDVKEEPSDEEFKKQMHRKAMDLKKDYQPTADDMGAF